MVKVSVIVPTYNRASVIKRALQSIYNQTYNDYEIIVVDDGSTDNTIEILEDERLRNPRLRYIRHKKNMGVSIARNTGIINSAGKYIAFLDSDDEWHREKLEEQVRIMNSNENIGLVYTGSKIIYEGLNNEDIIPVFSGYIFNKLLERNFIAASSVMVPKGIFNEIGLFDERLKIMQDWDMWLRISKRYLIIPVKKVLIKYYVHEKRISSNLVYRLHDYASIFRKYKDKIYSLGLSDKYYYYIARTLILSGDFKSARSFLIRAFHEKPRETRYIVCALLTLFGAYYSKIRQLLRVFKH